MEVVVHSTLNSVQGHVVIATDPGQTVDSLITAFCVEKGVQHRRHYVLRNKNLEILPNHHKIQACTIANRDALFLGTRDAEEEWCCGCNQWWLIAGVALLIGGAGLAAITVLNIMQNITLYQYGMTIDAGSSHTQLFVYRWPGGKENGTAIPEQVYTWRVEPGINSYVTNTSAAGDSLLPLLQHASVELGRTDIPKTPIYLGATAGMRLLNASNITTSDAIMNSTRSAIEEFKFEFASPLEQSKILDGKEEGAFSWVTVNYVSDVFSEVASNGLSSFFTAIPRPITKGAMDLGGASTQISFVPQAAVPDNSTNQETLIMFGHEYDVYTHSYLCYGVNEAQRQYQAQLVMNKNYSTVITDPCRPAGNNSTVSYTEVFEAPCTLKKSGKVPPQAKGKSYTFVGASNTTSCIRAVRDIFDFRAACGSTNCTFDGVSMAPVYGEFMAFSGFYYPMRFLNLTEGSTKFSLQQFTDAYTDLCNSDWATVSRMPARGGNLSLFCFQSVFIRTLLVDGYKFNNATWRDITFTKQINKTELGWTLGFMLNASHAIPQLLPHQRISTAIFVLLVVLFACFLGTAVGFACHARKLRNREGQYQRMSTYGAI